MMRVCIASQAPVGVSETFIQAHIDRLPFEVVHIHGYELDYICDGERVGSGARPDGPGWGKLLNLLPRFIEFRLRRRLERKVDPVEVVAGFLRDRRIDVVLAEYGTTAAFITPACRRAGIPLVAHFHGFDASRHRTIAQFGEAYRQMFSYATGVIAVSHAMRRALVGLGCQEDKITLNPYGPNPRFFDIGVDRASNQIVAIGRLTAKKAPHLLILAFSRAAERIPSLRLCLVGDGDLRSVCEDLIHSLGLTDRVQMKGARSTEEIAGLMAGSFCFVQHSIISSDGDSEGTPVAVLEAGAAGLPVVSTRHAGIPDVVVDGVTGLLVDERDVQAMAAAIVSLASDRTRAEAMGLAARERVSTLFTMERHLGSLADSIRNAASTSDGGSKTLSSKP